jgi:thiamine pyrophosphate-dependent acetolactate synthase large subunit-like protein
MTHLRGRPAGKCHIPIEFGAIDSDLPAAIGVAAARNNGRVLLIDGDGSLYQHIQELETVRCHGIKLLICIINDSCAVETEPARTIWARSPRPCVACIRSTPWARNLGVSAP